jgi:hypothetical protein
MDPVLWAAAIAGGVSVIGNVTTVMVARLGRDAQREQMESHAAVELVKLNNEADRVRDERREAARRERRELYGRLLAIISRLERYDDDEPGALDDSEYVATSHEYELLFSEVFMVGTEAVQEELGKVNDALAEIAANMRRFEGGPAQQFRAASRENHRGNAVVGAKGVLIYAMRADVAAPHLPGE